MLCAGEPQGVTKKTKQNSHMLAKGAIPSSRCLKGVSCMLYFQVNRLPVPMGKALDAAALPAAKLPSAPCNGRIRLVSQPCCFQFPQVETFGVTRSEALLLSGLP